MEITMLKTAVRQSLWVGRLVTTAIGASLKCWRTDQAAISVRSIWRTLDHREAEGGRSVGKFRAELIWREFAHHLLFHYPTLPESNWRESFDAFPWVDDQEALIPEIADLTRVVEQAAYDS